jgi:uncharacterized protein
MSIENNAVAYSAMKTQINAKQVLVVCTLLYEQDSTIPFIARYRKEMTGNLDEVQIRNIQNTYEEYIETEKRRTYILEQIKKQEQLTPELEKKLLAADSLKILEDLYAPYKSKKKTKAMLAKEYGLNPLADLLLSSKKSLSEIENKIGVEYLTLSKGKVTDFDGALACAMDIIIEQVAHNLEVKEDLRTHYWRTSKIVTGKRKNADDIKDSDKFKDFFEFDEPIKNLKDPRSSHRFLAMRRGMSLKVLKVEVSSDEDYAVGLINKEVFNQNSAHEDILEKCAKKAYNNFIHTSLDLEVKTDLKKIADEAAIDVFGVNLKNLLLQPYLGSKAVLGIDPGIRTGCKVVIIDNTGAYLGDHVIYPFEPKNDVIGSTQIIDKMIEMFNIEYIAIGNGTYGRETLAFIEKCISSVKAGKVKATMISESGASIYSASDIAREEFPDKDLTVRGAVSIARRFQDPLAELVKLDPKSIGVGQYQHDVNQIKLQKNLDGVVESCVNFVGVDLNTASAPLLSFVSAIGPSVAKNIVEYRSKNGGIKNREELLAIKRFSKKIFEQSAGFLRIYNGNNPLDGTFIHPEQYGTITKWTKSNKKELNDLLTDKELQNAFRTDQALITEIGASTHTDIFKSLTAPTQDPRSAFKSVEFSKDLKVMSDVQVNSWYTGIVTNITMFGAFVDIGIKENGLLHISQISNEFVENALDKLKVGQELKVKILEVDKDRKRIALSCKTDSTSDDVPSSYSGKKPAKKHSPKPEMKNNAFSGLKNFKLK